MIKLPLKCKTLDFELEGEKYVLNELNGEERDAYLQDAQDRSGQDGRPTTLKDWQANLIHTCLRNSEGKAIPVATIRKWCASTNQVLFDSAQELSGLVKKDEAAVKNA